MRGGRSSLANLGLRLGESVDFTVRGACMWGLDSGRPVRVRKQRVYVPGDVVVVRRLDHWNVHRFLGYAPTVHGVVALTQADDADQRDPAATVSAIVGRAQCRVAASDRVAACAKYARALVRRVAEVGR
jgi:hypothetical protein